MTALERFLNKISVSETNFYNGTACWEWTGSKRGGYGLFKVETKIVGGAHRFIFEYYYGEIKEGLVVHHLCYNRNCCNILHLDQRTHRENILDKDSSCPTAINSRKIRCKRGHEYNLENMYGYSGGRRDCKKCYVIRARQLTQRKNSETSPPKLTL